MDAITGRKLCSQILVLKEVIDQTSSLCKRRIPWYDKACRVSELIRVLECIRIIVVYSHALDVVVNRESWFQSFEPTELLEYFVKGCLYVLQRALAIEVDKSASRE